MLDTSQHIFINPKMLQLRRSVAVILKLDVFAAMALLTAIQVACRQPGIAGPTRQIVETLARAIQGVVIETPEFQQNADFGWDPNRDQ